MKAELWVVGQLKEPWAKEAVDRYLASLKALYAFSLVVIREGKKGSPEERKADESARLLRALGPRDRLVLFDERGKSYSSIRLAKTVEEQINGSAGKTVFLIGGPWGVLESVRDRADLMISLSSLVLPHELAAVVAAECLYRSWSILRGTGYHHS